MKKSISIIVASLGSGGAERVTTIIANYLANKGYKVRLIVFRDIYNEYDVSPNVELVFLKSAKNKLLDRIIKLIDLKKNLATYQSDIVISMGLYRYIWFGGIAKNYKCVFSERNDPSKSSMPEKYIKSICFRSAKRVVFQTKDAMDFYDSEIQKKGIIISNPISDNLPDPFIGSRTKRLVAVSRLSKQKNIPLLLDAFKEFSLLKKGYTLDIFGKGELEEDLKQYADNNGLHNIVNFKGFVNPVFHEIIDATMYISSSDYEGMSNAMIEAMAIGLPVICTDCPVGAARMIIQSGVNGILVPINNKEELKKAMVNIVDNPAKAEQMGRKATYVRELFNQEIICSKWIKLIEEIS